MVDLQNKFEKIKQNMSPLFLGHMVWYILNFNTCL